MTLVSDWQSNPKLPHFQKLKVQFLGNAVTSCITIVKDYKTWPGFRFEKDSRRVERLAVRPRETITPGKRRRFIGSGEEVASDIREYREVGVDTMIFDVRRPSFPATLERMEWMAKEVFPQV
jgi:alkanesulfonate monooxygenase SsuD/methylene tetrahydromethanopterin reductase-like flavin-dependent oxidoreductase (luciferase family)